MQNVTVADLSVVVKLVEKIEIHKGLDPFNLAPDIKGIKIYGKLRNKN